MKLRLPSYIPTKPTPKQAAFLIYDGLEALYGGAAGGGKSEALLMGALQYVDQKDYSAIILRRSYTDLALPGALMDRAREWLLDSKAKWDRERHTWTFPSGASLTFGYIATNADRFRYQSAEFQYIAFDEVTEFPDDEAYRFMFSRLRRTTASEIPLRVRVASNPVGVGAYWVRKRFLDNDPPPTDAEGNPDPGGRIFIPANFRDNPHLDQEAYLLSLQQLHPALQKRLIEGGWDEIEDAAYPEFHPDIHVVPAFAIPHGWRTWEGMDFGVSNPTAWLAAALSPEGDTIVFGEYYSPGLIQDHASRILTLRHNSWGQPSISVCDPSIRNRTGFGNFGMGETVHSEFSKNGISLVSAVNDRLAGRVRIAEMLRVDPSRIYPEWHPRAGEPGAPRLYFFQGCENVINQVRFAPIDGVEGETVDPYWESRRGHAHAALRYLVTARVYPRGLEAPEAGYPRGVRRKWPSWNEASWTEIG